MELEEIYGPMFAAVATRFGIAVTTRFMTLARELKGIFSPIDIVMATHLTVTYTPSCGRLTERPPLFEYLGCR